MADSPERLNGSLPVSSAMEAADAIPQNGAVAVSGFGRAGYPKQVPLALAERQDELSLTLVSGGSLGDEIDTTLVESGAVTRRFPYQATSAMRDRTNSNEIAFHDRHIAGFGDDIRRGDYGEIKVAIIEAVAVGEDWFIPSTSIGHTLACVRAASQLILEVNEAHPISLRRFHDIYDIGRLPDREPIPLSAPDQRIGASRVEFDTGKLAAVVETNSEGSPYSFRDPNDDDRAIAANLVAFLEEETVTNHQLEDRMTLQFGVGSLGNALMGEMAALGTDDRDLAYYGEVIQDGLLRLIDAGQLETASATSLALSEQGRRQLINNVDQYADSIVLRPAEISNGAGPIGRLGIIAVNTALEVDIYGHVNSTHIDGTHLMNGIGGSADFNRNAALTVVALYSTAKHVSINRIVPMVSHVDHTEHDIDIVVTECGVADMRGKSPNERAEAMIESCAHPRYRDALRSYVDQATTNGGHVPHNLASAFTKQS